MMQTYIPAHILQEVVKHAADRPDVEIVGMITTRVQHEQVMDSWSPNIMDFVSTGPTPVEWRYTPLINMHEYPSRAFSVDTKKVVEHLEGEDGEFWFPLVLVHSHPLGNPTPSLHDTSGFPVGGFSVGMIVTLPQLTITMYNQHGTIDTFSDAIAGPMQPIRKILVHVP